MNINPSSEAPAAPLDQELQKIAGEVCRRGLGVPAVFFLELYKPLTGVLHAGSLVCMPVFSVLFGSKGAQKVLRVLEDRRHVELLIRQIEKLEEK